MGELKIIGPDGRPIPAPSKDNPQGLKAAAAALNQPKTIAHIDLFPDGRFGLKHLLPLSPLDYAFVLSNLVFTLLAEIRNAVQAIPPDEETPKGGQDAPT